MQVDYHDGMYRQMLDRDRQAHDAPRRESVQDGLPSGSGVFCWWTKDRGRSLVSLRVVNRWKHSWARQNAAVELLSRRTSGMQGRGDQVGMDNRECMMTYLTFYWEPLITPSARPGRRRSQRRGSTNTHSASEKERAEGSWG